MFGSTAPCVLAANVLGGAVSVTFGLHVPPAAIPLYVPAGRAAPRSTE